MERSDDEQAQAALEPLGAVEVEVLWAAARCDRLRKAAVGRGDQ